MNIVVVTSDEPNVMKKFGRESPCEIVLCLNHAIRLSVLDTFCKKIEKAKTNDSIDSLEDSKLGISISSEDSECDDNEETDDDVGVI